MMNSKETLKKLHKRFPQLSLDELFDALDCYVEEYNFFTKPYWTNNTGVFQDTDLRIKSTEPNLKYYGGDISTTAESGNCQLTADHSIR